MKLKYYILSLLAIFQAIDAKRTPKDNLIISNNDENNEFEPDQNELIAELINAIENNNLDRVNEILETHIDINRSNHLNQIPLHEAARLNNGQIVEILLAQRANPNRQNIDDLKTALMLAITYGNEEIANTLITHPRADLNLQDDEGYTALMHAVLAGNLFLVEALLAAGANPDIKNYDGLDPATIAEELGFDAIRDEILMPK